MKPKKEKEKTRQKNAETKTEKMARTKRRKKREKLEGKGKPGITQIIPTFRQYTARRRLVSAFPFCRSDIIEWWTSSFCKKCTSHHKATSNNKLNIGEVLYYDSFNSTAKARYTKLFLR